MNERIKKVSLKFLIVLFTIFTLLSFVGLRANSSTASATSAPASFVMLEGASVRTETPMGIRFVATISAEDFGNIPANTEFGMILAPSDFLNADDDLVIGGALKEIGKGDIDKTSDKYYARATMTPVVDINDFDKDGDKTEYLLRCSFVGIKNSNFSRPFTAKAYYKTGELTPVYSSNVSERSVYTVAVKSLYNKDHTDSDVISYLSDIASNVSDIYGATEENVKLFINGEETETVKFGTEFSISAKAVKTGDDSKMLDTAFSVEAEDGVLSYDEIKNTYIANQVGDITVKIYPDGDVDSEKTITKIITVEPKTQNCEHDYKDGVCTECGGLKEGYIQKHLIKDANGNYGGSLDVELYGEGAPLNGKYDVENSEYYTVNDYYNMKSTSERTMHTNFAPYQQTMKDTSGIAGAVAVLNHWGEDITTLNEKELVEKYQTLNNTTVYGRGTSASGLANLFNDLGYETTVGGFEDTGTNDRQANTRMFKEWLIPTMEVGGMVFVRWQDNMDNRWKVIVGYDDVGSPDYYTDDIIIFADPYDGFDHRQDGYSTMGAGRFVQWFFQIDMNTFAKTKIKDSLTVMPKTPIELVRVESDPTDEVRQSVPDLHLLLNEDGSYGGSINKELYGSGTPLNGARNQFDENYYKFVDYYNMESTSSRTILKNYRAFSQRMSSSCGICSAYSILMYYGYSDKIYNELDMVLRYEELNDCTIYNKGIGIDGLRIMLEDYGFPSENIETGRYFREDMGTPNEPIFATYEQFKEYAVGHLKNDTPILIGHRPHGGHYEVLIGLDDMGTPDYIYDDVIILADSGDSYDHYQDGYNTYPATLFFRQWYSSNLVRGQTHLVLKKVDLSVGDDTKIEDIFG